MINNTKFRI